MKEKRVVNRTDSVGLYSTIQKNQVGILIVIKYNVNTFVMSIHL